MNEAGVGRLLVASLHQGIADTLPARLEFYENWLHAAGLRDGKIGLAPLAAVLSFLRQEGKMYAATMDRAGVCAADWTFRSMSPLKRALVRAAPLRLRARLILRIGRLIVQRTYANSRSIVCLKKGSGTFEIRGSIFCEVRAPLGHPLCGFYAAAIGRLLALFETDGSATIMQCRGVGDSMCQISFIVREAAAPQPEASQT